MERQLRLAERRGLLTGKSVSPVAEFGIELLHFLDARARNTAEVDAVKVAMIAHDPSSIKTLYPQWFLEADEVDTVYVLDGSEEAERIRAEESYEEDYSDVEWISPEDAEFEELMRLAETVGAAQAITLHQDEGGEWF